MTPARRRSVLVGLALGAVSSIGAAFLLVPRGDGVDAVLAQPGTDVLPTQRDITGRRVPAQQFERLDGGTASFEGYAGRPVVVNFWASTCAPCLKEMPAFEEVHRELGDRVAFVGVNVQDSVSGARGVAQRTGVTYDLWRDPSGEMFADLELAVLPTTVLVSPEGAVLRTRPGALDAEELRALIAEAL